MIPVLVRNIHLVAGLPSGTRTAGRMILICSEASLKRSGVQYEIEQALVQEAQRGGAQVLLPIRLDSYVFDGDWAPADRLDLKQEVLDRVVADFTGTKTGKSERAQAKFDEGLSKLLLALRKPTPPPTST